MLLNVPLQNWKTEKKKKIEHRAGSTRWAHLGRTRVNGLGSRKMFTLQIFMGFLCSNDFLSMHNQLLQQQLWKKNLNPKHLFGLIFLLDNIQIHLLWRKKMVWLKKMQNQMTGWVKEKEREKKMHKQRSPISLFVDVIYLEQDLAITTGCV